MWGVVAGGDEPLQIGSATVAGQGAECKGQRRS